MRRTSLLTFALLVAAACGPADPPPDAPALAPAPTPAPTPAPAPAPAPDPAEAPSPPSDLAPPPKPTRTVLLIPGTMITGDYFDTMAARLAADGFDPVVYEPPDLLAGSLADGAAGIGRVVDALLARTGDAKLHIVAECDGGVATRYWLQVLGGHPKVDQVVTFVSAHHGTWKAPLASWVPGMQSMDDITPGSAFMRTLDAAPFPAGLRLTSIYSCNDALMEPYTTSVVAGATNVLFCRQYIGHFDGFWDTVVYARILSALRNQPAPTSY